MRATQALSILAVAAALLGGCVVVNDTHLEELRDAGSGPTDAPTGTDAPMEDANVPEDLLRTVDRCGDSMALVLDDSTGGQVTIDTTGHTNRTSSCASRDAPGNDGFVAIDVLAGDQWHFHVIPDPSVADQDRNPFLYLLSEGCDNRDCEHQSDQCQGGGDEHFAFVAPTDGRWYLGIDDRNAGGGRYLLEAVRLLCGDGVKVHGEACDGTTNCSRNCREVLSDTRPAEQIPNDNEIEANEIDFPASGEITISGSIGGDLCIYPDVYTFAVDTADTTLTARILKSDGSACDNPSLTPFDIVLRTAAGEERAGGMTNSSTGCSELTVTGLASGTYLLYLEHDTPIEDRPVTYQLHLQQSL